MRAEGWARLYWMTREDNERARKLYDQFAQADGFVRYVIRQRNTWAELGAIKRVLLGKSNDRKAVNDPISLLCRGFAAGRSLAIMGCASAPPGNAGLADPDRRA